jgi:hypothetical protein
LLPNAHASSPEKAAGAASSGFRQVVAPQVALEPDFKAWKEKISWTICRIPVWPFDYMVKAGQPARPKTKKKDHYRRKEKSCHSIWLLTTSPTTSTRPP